MFKQISYTIITVFTLNLLATSGDIAIAWCSPVFIKLRSNDTSINPIGHPITDTEESYIGSLVNIGAMIGPFPYSFISEKFGRKIALLCIAIPHIISYLILAFADRVYIFYIARVLGGLAVGGGYTLLPMYVAEVAEDSMRGMLSSTLNIFWTFGSLVPYVIGPYLPMMWFNLVLVFIPTSFFILFFLIAPETPYYLIKKNKLEQAEKSLMKLRTKTKPMVKEEMEHIQEVLAHSEESKFVDLFKEKIYLKALGISLMLIIAQQLSGINAVLMYTQKIFSAAGSQDIPDEVSSIIVGLALFASSFVTPFVADSLGRRKLLLLSFLGSVISLSMLGVFFYMQARDKDSVTSISFLPILSMICYIITFNVGLGPIPWTISSELFPANIKPAAASIISACSWIGSFLVTNFFTQIQKSLGEGETFWLLAGCCGFGFFFTFFFVPETKGKSFKEIQKILGGVTDEKES